MLYRREKVELNRFMITAALLAASCVASAQVYRCSKPGGGTIYTDAPCAGKKIEERALRANQLQPTLPAVVAPPAARIESYGTQVTPPGAQAAARTGYCPEPIDIKNIETAASSHEFNRRYEEQRFLLDQARTWRSCNPAYSRLTPETWAALKETHADQTAHDPQVRYRARARAAEIMSRL